MLMLMLHVLLEMMIFLIHIGILPSIELLEMPKAGISPGLCAI
jgi:hypothetical protein